MHPTMSIANLLLLSFEESAVDKYKSRSPMEIFDSLTPRERGMIGDAQGMTRILEWIEEHSPHAFANTPSMPVFANTQHLRGGQKKSDPRPIHGLAEKELDSHWTQVKDSQSSTNETLIRRFDPITIAGFEFVIRQHDNQAFLYIRSTETGYQVHIATAVNFGKLLDTANEIAKLVRR